MSEYPVALIIACTLVTLSYMALKIQHMRLFEHYEQIATPILTGAACILLMQQPLPAEFGVVDLRYLPIVMAGLRYGLTTALLSTLLPVAYSGWTADLWFFQALQNLVVPAVLSSLFHQSSYKKGSRIPYSSGLKISFLLLVTQAVIHAALHPDLNIRESAPLVFMFLVSAVCLSVLIGMCNDENEKWMMQRKLELQASQDLLTGLPNLRSFLDIAGRTLAHRRMAVFMIDIDNFKRYNDRWGHLQGDQLLREAGGLLRSSLHAQDYIARYGGEEFVLMSTETDPERLQAYAERLIARVSSHPFPHAGETPVTISMGMSIAEETGLDLQSLINEADQALYTSKNTGKNRCTAFVRKSYTSAEQQQQNAY
ncbi:GGDEF domain-containing protein [Paenibacillus lutrae]|uniref:Diguanylate cyclase n=1 Tax=Paenibacillus lutrae TaxID=2078573 RepID=A0A7X3FLG2_9BACL|nr:GGDEF domain-containing protein [Paenibacillus lutrae]MVP01782.1 diguanylate cyclase [Paenibacillus lutrae]